MFTVNKNTKQVLISIFIVLVPIFSIYSRMLFNQFVWDDKAFILEWQAPKDFPSSTISMIKGNLPEDHQHAYRPLRSIYYGISFQLWGYNASGYHLQAMVVHSLATIFIMLIAYELSKNQLWMILSGLLFGLHPLNSEPVLWITSSFDTVGNVFYFASFYFYIFFREKKIDTLKKIAIACATVAFYSYELTLTLPAILILYDYLIIQKKIDYKEYSPFFIAQLPYWLMRFGILELNSNKPPLFESVSGILLTMVILLQKYFTLFIFLWVQNVNHLLRPDMTAFFYHDLNMEKPPSIPSLIDPDVLISLVVLIGISLFIFKYRKKYKYLSFGLVAFFLTLVPVMQIFPRAIIFSERYLYLGGGLLIASVCVQLSRLKEQKLLLIPGLLLLAVFITKLSMRIPNWQSNTTLWQASIETNPISPTLYRNLGDEYFKAHDYVNGIEATQKGLAINPNDPFLRENLIVGYINSKQFDKALRELALLRSQKPSYDLGYIKAGDIYYVTDDFEKAKDFYQQALELPTSYRNYLENKLREINALQSK